MSSGYIEFEELMPIVVQYLFNEGVQEETFNKNRAIYFIRHAYIEFIKRSHLIRRTIVINGQKNVQEYPIFENDEYIVNKIYSVETERCCYDLGDFCQCNCCPCTYHYQDGMVNLCPAPDCDEDIELCVSLFPNAKECKMEEWIFERYKHEIAMGAVASLVSKKASAPFEAEYDAGIHRGSGEAAKSWSKNRKKGRKVKWQRR